MILPTQPPIQESDVIRSCNLCVSSGEGEEEGGGEDDEGEEEEEEEETTLLNSLKDFWDKKDVPHLGRP